MIQQHRLVAPATAARDLARLLLSPGAAQIEVLEEKCFPDGVWWHLADVHMQAEAEAYEDTYESVSKGAYELHLTSLSVATARLCELLGVVEPSANSPQSAKDQYGKSIARVGRIMDAVATVSVRLGLTHPVFDSTSVELMPLRRSVTVVADTSGVLQGGLSFVASFLHPAARIKIPAVVYMEIVNQADNYFKRRHNHKRNSGAMLLDHLVSQAGQRAVMRLELSADTQIERNLLVGDPLRNAFQRDTDPEWSELNLSVPLRSYCDRLVIEAARQHQTYASPGHEVELLTSDQGLARMALAEGIVPLYFRQIAASRFFGQRLAGTVFHPLSGSLYRIPLQMVLWELATVFGAARLISNDRTSWVEIAAIGETLSWSPVHSRQDLLWMRSEALPEITERVEIARDRERVKQPTASRAPARHAGRAAPPAFGRPLRRGRALAIPRAGTTPYYRVSVERVVRLVGILARDGRLPVHQVMSVLGTSSQSALAEYRRFLAAGGFVQEENELWFLTDAGLQLADALTAADIERLAELLARVSSVSLLLERIRHAPIGAVVDLNVPERAAATYRVLAELVCMGAVIPGEGLFPTVARPSLEDFAEVALERFMSLETGDGVVPVGTWLETLVKQDGIHPELARRYLDEANAAGLLFSSTEGSTTDTRRDDHMIHVLRNDASGPTVVTVHLYRGDFLVPGKSSSSMRLSHVTAR